MRNRRSDVDRIHHARVSKTFTFVMRRRKLAGMLEWEVL
jgi:hypothetical protein